MILVTRMIMNNYKIKNHLVFTTSGTAPSSHITVEVQVSHLKDCDIFLLINDELAAYYIKTPGNVYLKQVYEKI
ncbi:unnamed protein product [Amoebophrya sp. A25]|nr:unnamed protein product [Amoebophrya sp. A25]|eukprot:GSA25T00027690001.1